MARVLLIAPVTFRGVFIQNKKDDSPNTSSSFILFHACPQERHFKNPDAPDAALVFP
jgi:hypothetical protein